jgi:hypothetical protein
MYPSYTPVGLVIRGMGHLNASPRSANASKPHVRYNDICTKLEILLLSMLRNSAVRIMPVVGVKDGSKFKTVDSSVL